jgi:hypothetical protein
MEERHRSRYRIEQILPTNGGQVLPSFLYVTEVRGRRETLVPLLATAFYNTKFWR